MAKTVCIIAGARPNFVKVSPLVRAINKNPEATCLLVYAGSENDPTLEPSLFEDLQMPRPQYYLGVDSTSLNEITSQVMARFDAFLDEHTVDVVIVVDDLASTMAAAIVTKKRGIRLAHLVDALSDYLFTAGVKSTGVATREQSENSQTYMVGNILMDTLRFNYDRLKKPVSIPSLEEKKYLVFTLNRKALIADVDNLERMLKAMVESANGIRIIAPLRGNAKKVVESMNLPIEIVEPLSYLEFGWLTAHALGIITDSGNVSEEATFNGVPCITLNNYTEHQETVNVGSNVLVGEDADKLREQVAKMIAGEWKKCALPDRWDGRTAERIVQIILA